MAVDPNLLLLSWLRSIPEVLALFPDRGPNKSLYAVDLPEQFDISLGPALTVTSMGGQSNIEVNTIYQPRIQVKIWADVHQNALARDTYGKLADIINGKGNIAIGGVGTIMSIYETVPPQDITDPGTDWATVTAFYEMITRG